MQFLLLRSASVFFEVINLLLVVRVLLSWTRSNQYNRYIVMLYHLTDPLLEPFKRLTNRMGANQMIDWSPLLAMLCIQYLIQPLVLTLIRLFF